jgi:hypothetical protein
MVPAVCIDAIAINACQPASQPRDRLQAVVFKLPTPGPVQRFMASCPA